MSEPIEESAAKRAMKIGRELWPAVSAALGGEPPGVQGAVLADLTAGWIAGHMVPGNPAATDQMREELLALHLDVIRKLIPVSEAEIYPELKR